MSNKPELKKEFSKPLAFWHWSNLLTIALILLTVLMVKTIFNSRANAPVVQAALEKKGVLINAEQARVVTKIYSKQLWDWHVYFGYALTALLLFRILLEFYQSEDSKLWKRFKQAKSYLENSGTEIKAAQHIFVVKLTYFVFYACLLLMVSTGLFIKFSSDYPNLKPIKEFLKEVHNVGMYVILSFIVVHLAGLWLHERKIDKLGKV
ncbi:MAG: cytochrome b/b6 domain-containing protein [Bacteroidota bacterium]